MTDRDRSSGLERRAFLRRRGIGGRGVGARAGRGAGPNVGTDRAVRARPGIQIRTAEHLVGSAVNYAYAVKAGPFVFLNGHEGYDFAAGVVPAVEGPAGFPEYGKPGLRREADFIFERMGQILKSLGTDLAHSVRLDQYYTDANAVRAYHLARFAALGKYVPPSTSIITERCFGGKSTMTTSLVAVLPDPQWEIKGVYPESCLLRLLGLRARGGDERFRVRGGSGTRREGRARHRSAGRGRIIAGASELPIRRQAESALKRIESTLNAAGTSLANCLKAQVHIAGEENFPDFLDVWNEHVGASPAALTVTPAKAFAAVEIIVVDKLHPAQGRRAAQEGDRARRHSGDGVVFAGGPRRRIRVQPGPAADEARRNGGGSAPRR